MKTLVNGELIMRFGIVALLAAVAAASPAFATNAFLGGVKNAVETFDEYQVGDVIDFKWAPVGGIGQPRPFLELHGVVEEDAGNKYLELFNSQKDAWALKDGYAVLGQHNLSIGNGWDYKPGEGEVTTSTIHSIDFLSQNGGTVFKASGGGVGHTVIATIPVGGWSTVKFGTTTNGDFGMIVDGPGRAPFSIDNIRYSAFTNRIPEPASWMMMIAGFGLVGAAMRRRGPGGRSHVGLGAA